MSAYVVYRSMVLMSMTKRNSRSVCRDGGMKKRKKGFGRRKPSWPCKEMSTLAWERSEGLCEACGRAVPLGTPAAHLIPKSAVGETSHEPWNLAMLCIAEPQCHRKLDDDRPGAAKEEWLHARIQEEPRLEAYFERLIGRAEYLRDTQGLT